jgi:hypothetical protein
VNSPIREFENPLGIECRVTGFCVAQTLDGHFDLLFFHPPIAKSS